MRTCPHCGKQFTSPTAKGCLWVVIVIAIIIIYGSNTTSTQPTHNPPAKAATPKKPAYNPPNMGEWITNRSVNPVNSHVTGALMVESTTNDSTYKNAPQLIIRCENGNSDFYINWHDYLADDKPLVTTRIGQQEAKTTFWTISTNNTTTFYNHDVGELINELIKHETFVAKTTPYNENPKTAVFPIQHLNNALENILDTCAF